MKSAKPQERRGKGTKKKSVNVERQNFWQSRYRAKKVKDQVENYLLATNISARKRV
jgi:hypothetical protein